VPNQQNQHLVAEITAYSLAYWGLSWKSRFWYHYSE